MYRYIFSRRQAELLVRSRRPIPVLTIDGKEFPYTQELTGNQKTSFTDIMFEREFNVRPDEKQRSSKIIKSMIELNSYINEMRMICGPCGGFRSHSSELGALLLQEMNRQREPK